MPYRWSFLTMRLITPLTLTPFTLLFLTTCSKAFLYPTQIPDALTVDHYPSSFASGSNVPMVQVLLVQQARTLTRKIPAKNPPITPKTIFPSNSALDDPDYVPTEEDENEYPDTLGEAGPKMRRRPQLDKRQEGSTQLFDQLQRKVNLDDDGNILYLFPKLENQIPVPEESLDEFPTMWKREAVREKKWRPWRGSNVYNWKKLKQKPVTRGKWNLRYDGRVNAYKKVYDWENGPEVHVETRGAVQKRNPEPVADPEPMADSYSETGLALSITSPIDVLRERIRVENERGQRRRANALARSNYRNRHKNLQNIG